MVRGAFTHGDVVGFAFGGRGRRVAQTVLVAAQAGLAAAYYFFGKILFSLFTPLSL